MNTTLKNEIKTIVEEVYATYPKVTYTEFVRKTKIYEGIKSLNVENLQEVFEQAYYIDNPYIAPEFKEDFLSDKAKREFGLNSENYHNCKLCPYNCGFNGFTEFKEESPFNLPCAYKECVVTTNDDYDEDDFDFEEFDDFED